MVSVDIGEYARTAEDAWRNLRQQLKQVVSDIAADDTRLSELQEEIAVLRRANADRLSVLQELSGVALEEQQRATSLTLNDTDDEVVLDKETSVIRDEPEQHSSVPPVDEGCEQQLRPILPTPGDPDSGTVLDEGTPPERGELEELSPHSSAEVSAAGAQADESDAEKSSPAKAKRSKSKRTDGPPALQQASLLEDVAEEARHDERE